jgi:hypothetical protein
MTGLPFGTSVSRCADSHLKEMMGNMRKSLLATFASASLLAGIPALLTADIFTLPSNCTLPFDQIATKPDPVQQCGADGSSESHGAVDTAKALQDEAKNNFCADASSPVTVDFANLIAMQQQAPPKSALVGGRNALHGFFSLGGNQIGEGTVVRLLAFIKEAHTSDCEGGEDVNCNLNGVANNDFHIVVMDPLQKNPRNLPECDGVIVEMSPHFRPAAWSQIDLKTPIKNPVRVTGALFYDDEHEPCSMAGGKLTGHSGDPDRISLWEIHPIYALDVCMNTDPTKCDVTSTSAATWMPYDQWVTKPWGQFQATGKQERTACSGRSNGRASIRQKGAEAFRLY